ncbi:MAG: right-handed parallel beta-helix repeat-containing protein, partial [Planctomycetota bacterium]
MRRLLLPWVWVLLLAATLFAEPMVLDQNWVESLERRVGSGQDGTIYQHILHVEPHGELSTLGDAMQTALPLLERGESVQIKLPAGTFRESLGHVVFTGEAVETPLAIVGAGAGRTVLSGSDLRPLDEWTDLGEGLYRIDWPHDWGNWAYPWETPGVLGHRSEMVFVNGGPMRPTLLETYDYGRTGDDMDHGDREQTWTYTGMADPASLPPGSFGVAEREENGNALYLRLPSDVVMDNLRIEVSSRRQLLRFNGGDHFGSGKNNFTLRGVTVQHFASRTRNYGEEATISLGRNSQGVHLEGCDFLWNSAHGLSLEATGVTLRDCRFSFNGFSGIGAGLDNALIEGCTTNFNNWRGALGDQRGWWLGGVKLQRSVGNVVRGHRSIGNLAPGFWYDIQNEDIYLADCQFLGNDGAGLFFEISNGPLLAERIVSASNHGALLLSIVGHVELRDSVLHTTSPGQTWVKEDRVPYPTVLMQWYLREDEHVARETALVPERVELRDCVLLSSGDGMTIVQNNGVTRTRPEYEQVDKMYRGNGNTFSPTPRFGWVTRNWATVLDQPAD